MSILQTGPLVRRFARNPLGRDLIVGDLQSGEAAVHVAESPSPI